MTRYVILGMGAAGIVAAETIRLSDPGGEIICISPEKEGYYSRPGLAYYLSNEISKRSLFPFSREDFQKRGIKVFNKLAVQIDAGEHEVIFQDGKRLRYDRLCIAIGMSAVKPKIDGLDLDGVLFLDSYAETQKMVRKSRWLKKAVVVGGGITALELAEGLAARGVRVSYLLRGEQYWGRVLDQIESRIVMSRLRQHGVEVLLNTEIERIVGRRNSVQAVVTRDGRKIPTRMVGIAVGVKPRLGLARASKLKIDRGIRVNQYMQTDQPDVFAAGDVAEVYDPASGEWLLDSLWPIAREQGIIAGLNMTGTPTDYRRRSPLNVTRLTGLTTTIIGKVGIQAPSDDLMIVRGESETWQQNPEAIICQNNFDVNRIRIMLGKRHLLGAVVMGDQTISRPLEELVAEQVDISPIRAELVRPGADLSQTINAYWKSWRRADAD